MRSITLRVCTAVSVLVLVIPLPSRAQNRRVVIKVLT